MCWECGEGESCLTLDFDANTIRVSLNASRLAGRKVASALAHSRGGGTAARMTRRTPKGNTSIP
jgi:hypothetical protein